MLMIMGYKYKNLVKYRLHIFGGTGNVVGGEFLEQSWCARSVDRPQIYLYLEEYREWWGNLWGIKFEQKNFMNEKIEAKGIE